MLSVGMIQSINRHDVYFFQQSVEGIISASKEDLVVCPGLGPQKVRKTHVLSINIHCVDEVFDDLTC